MNINLTGRIALVTGASGGIGRGVASMLAASGAKVALNYLNSRTGAEEAVAAIRAAGGEAEAFQADVTKPEQIEGMIRSVEAYFGGSIDLLVNNAGHLVQRLANEEMTEDLYTKVMDVNLKSTVFVSKYVIPGMKAKGRGSIVNMTSIAAHNGGGPGASIYAASKAAVLAYTKGLAKELAASGITVNGVSPGFIGQTAFHDTFTPDAARKATVQSIPLGREGTPEDVAGAVLFLVSELSSYLTGETIEINGGMFMR
ncbi:SDR family NAD(P)-dependent oxidoreductase [Paenibacillus sp. PL91]|uniref:SDR family NAD(P)-dependent oxidoreductase n=1 Tax=Paenibacillus sp. PL91 TaxID=2729538 RepID=UPI00145D9743|nr:3-oxoacyl-ACP reductase family protein [Paenibacillus sp. PL91]MBC9201160.1 3-oxoacyl-ACP reductase FabG [Paenibacillus sp. PL91]